MDWAAPSNAWLIVLLIPAVLLLRRAARQRRHDLLLVTRDGVVSRKHRGQFRQRLACLLPAAAFLLIVAALCRPQWGELSLQQQGKALDILIALDVSRSMLADDLPPTRLAAAKVAVSALLSQLQGERIGLIAFAGSAFLVCPLTSDYASFAAVLAETGPETIPLGGTSLAPALNEARRALRATPGGSKTLIVISDGEDHDSDAAATETLHDSGVTVHSVAVGSVAGGLIRLADGEFLRNRQGSVVRSRLQTQALQRLAAANAGRLFDLAADSNALQTLYATQLAAAERLDSRNAQRRLAERFQWPLALALLLLLSEPFFARR